MNVEDKERNKYERMWSFPQYRGWSPGFDAAPVAYRTMQCKEGETLIDMGCGTGRAGTYFADEFAATIPAGCDLKETFVERCTFDAIESALDIIRRDMLHHIRAERIVGAQFLR